MATDKYEKYSMAPILYQPEGKIISKRLWSETLEELSFANAATVLDVLSEK